MTIRQRIRTSKMKLAFCLILFCIVVAIPCAQAQTAPVDNGLSWLRANQRSDGSWGSLNSFRDTSSVIESYRLLGQTDSSYQNAATWLNGYTIESNDYVAKRIAAQAAAGVDVSADLSLLLVTQNSDGGWGYYPEFASDAYDTIMVLNLLNPAASGQRTRILSGINYLISTQNADGSWSMIRDSAGDVTTTGLAVVAMKRLGSTPAAAATVVKAVTWLNAKQNPDGGFGSSPSTVHDTVYAVTALLASGNLQAPAMSGAFDYLTASQLPDGSWNESAYETALALKTLGNMKANVAIFQSDLTASTTSPKSGEQVVLRAVIRNIGSKEAANVAVQFSVKTTDGTVTNLGAPRIIPLLAVGTFSTEELVIDTTGTQGLFDYIVTIDPGNTLMEFSKDDNLASLRISVTPVPDLTVSNDTLILSNTIVSIGSDVTITASIANQGNLPAQNVEVEFYHDAPRHRGR